MAKNESVAQVNRHSTGGQIQILVAPVKWTTTVSIKARFQDWETPVRVLGVRSLEAAISQLDKSDRYHAILVDWDESPTEGVALACAVKERGSPILVAYQKHWPRDDIRRALQLGVDCLLLEPFSAADVMRDIQAIHDNGVSISRSQIIDQGGEELLASDPALWDEQAEDWRDRMISVADHLSRPWSEDMTDHASHMEVSVRRGAQIDQLSPNMARAVLEVLSQGRDRIPEITGRYKLDAEELIHVLSAVEKFAKKHGGVSRIPLLMDAVLNREQSSEEDARSPRLMVLKRVARVVIRANGVPARRKDPLSETVKKFLGVPDSISGRLSSKVRFNLAIRLIMAEEENDALDFVGFTLLAQLIQTSRGTNVDNGHLEALNSLLGFDGRHTGIDPKKLIRQLAVLNPIPALVDIDLLELNSYREALENSAFDEYRPLASALEQLTDVARPLGPIDQKRLKDLSQAIRQELPVLVGRPTWRSLLRALTEELVPPTDQIMKRLTFLMGARSEESRKMLQQAIRDLLEVGQSAMDAARFAEFCRQASAEPLSRDVISEFAGETHTEFTPDRVQRQGAAERRALLEGALSSFQHMNIDLEQIRQYLPPPPRGYTTLSDQEMTRMQVLAAVLEGRPLQEQQNILQHFLGEHKLWTPEIEALRSMLGACDVMDLIAETLHDPSCEIRDGFDYEVELERDEAAVEGFYGDDDDDDEDWDDVDEDEELSSIADVESAHVFDLGAAPPPRPSRPPHQVEAFDLGLEELELELDLSGGVFDLDASVTGSLDGDNLTAADISTSVAAQSRRTGEFDRPRQHQQRDERSGQSRQHDSMSNFDDSVDDVDYGSVRGGSVGTTPPLSQGFDLGGPSSGFDLGPRDETPRNRRRDTSTAGELALPLTPDGRLDLIAIGDMISSNKLKDAARLLHNADEDLPDLAKGLNLTALHAIGEERHHAAQMLWAQALKLDPLAPNIMYSLARVRVELGKYEQAEPVLNRLLELMPHFSLAHELLNTIRTRRGGD
jgi:CheY-like chemotaxis protein